MWGRMLALDSPEVSRFFNRLAGAERGCLMLDYDGTLAPFTVNRAEAYPYSGVREALQKIVEQGRTVVAVVSGRAVHEVRQLLGISDGIEFWGSHGAERIGDDGVHWVYELTEQQAQGISKAGEEIDAIVPAAHIENKVFSIAVHWRGVADDEARNWEREVLRNWREIARGSSLEIHRFNGGVEIRPPDATKATAVQHILAEIGDDCPPAYLGDDLTDEDAFGVMPADALSVLVGDEPRESGAIVFLRRPDEVLEFLYRWHSECG